MKSMKNRKIEDEKPKLMIIVSKITVLVLSNCYFQTQSPTLAFLSYFGEHNLIKCCLCCRPNTRILCLQEYKLS